MLINLKLFQLNFFTISIRLIIDIYRILFSIRVVTISSCVMFYSTSYIKDEVRKSRFYKLVFGFVLRILILILSSNLFFILIGWDGLGVLSFILVIFYQREGSLGSGLITLFSNRVGDGFLLMLIGTLRIVIDWGIRATFTTLIIILIMLGSITKRAQIPFSSWLPRAIAAPTPISALVHSRTLVTAGVFLLIRFRSLLDYSFLLRIGSITALLAGLAGIVEHDLKKIIALSTLSQLGVIFIRLGLNLPNVAFFHLLTHAFFKRIIFICAGDIISRHQGNQDIRLYGNFFLINSLTSIFMLRGSLALIGLPFIAGFYSKDAILENFIIGNLNSFLCMLGWAGIVTTTVYRVRLIINRAWQASTITTMYFNCNWIVFFPVFILNLGAISFGSLFSYYLYYIPFFRERMLKLIPFFIFIVGLRMGLIYWSLEIKTILLASFGFLNVVTEHTSKVQSNVKTVVLVSERGWLEMLPSRVQYFISNIKWVNIGISTFRLALLFLL